MGTKWGRNDDHSRVQGGAKVYMYGVTRFAALVEG